MLRNVSNAIYRSSSSGNTEMKGVAPAPPRATKADALPIPATPRSCGRPDYDLATARFLRSQPGLVLLFLRSAGEAEPGLV